MVGSCKHRYSLMGSCLTKHQANHVTPPIVCKHVYIEEDVSITPVKTKNEYQQVDYRSSRILDVIYPSDLEALRSSMTRSHGSGSIIYGTSPNSRRNLIDSPKLLPAIKKTDVHIRTPQKRIIGFNMIMQEPL